MSVIQIYNRDGKIVEFNVSEIKNDIYDCMLSSGNVDINLLHTLTDSVASSIKEKNRILGVEEIQDVIEIILLKDKNIKLYKHYVLNREKKYKERLKKRILGVKDDVGICVESIKLIEKCLEKDTKGNNVETTSEMFRRVARNIAQAEYLYGKREEDVLQLEQTFFDMMSNLEFLPSLPTLKNAGTESQYLMGFCVIPVDDSMESISEAFRQTTLINKSGGSVGLSFSRLRSKNDTISSGRAALGPLYFMKLFDNLVDRINIDNAEKNSILVNIDHPDIIDIVTSSSSLKNFSLYLGVTEDFVLSVINNTDHYLINPKTDELSRRIGARSLLELISLSIWMKNPIKIVFIDKINEDNNISISHIEAISSQPMMPYESLASGAINLVKFVKNRQIDWENLRKIVRLSTNFLDNSIEMSRYPAQEIEMMTKGNRKLGVGLVGFSEMLKSMDVVYGSEECMKISEDLIRFVNEESRFKSQIMASDRGTYENYDYSTHKNNDIKIRNSCRISINPSFYLSGVFNTTPGITPLEVVPDYAENYIKIQNTFEKYSDGFVHNNIILSDPTLEDIKKIFMNVHNLGFRSLEISIVHKKTPRKNIPLKEKNIVVEI